MRLRFFLFFFVFFSLPFCSAAHYIVGNVNDALNGVDANDHEVVLWNPVNGMDDNLTDIIGPNGNSGTDNIYMIDCEMLATPCSLGDEMRIKVYDSGDSYVSEFVSVVVSGAAFDTAPNITLNSPPNSTLNLPLDFANPPSSEIDFNCSAIDLDSNLANISLYGDWSGGWHLNETLSVSGGSDSVIFTKILPEGNYEWNCLATDNLSTSLFFEENFSLNVGSTLPSVNSVLVNETHVCGVSSFVRVTCNTNDSGGIENVTIQAISSGGEDNFSAQFLSGDDYYSDLVVDELGTWFFNCIVYNVAENFANLTSPPFVSYSVSPEIEGLDLNFSNSDPLEGEEIILNATFSNLGCSNANNFLVGFYDGDPAFGGQQIGENQTLSIFNLSNSSVNISWSSVVGPTNIFVFADVEDSISEINESNNKINKTIDVNVWQKFYGNVSGTKLLADSLMNNVSSWFGELNFSGNVFMIDKEGDIDWLALRSIGKTILGGSSSNDFSEIDGFLGMQNFKDSVSVIFSDGGTPKNVEDFLVHKKNVIDVPIVNSTSNSNFVTGILWDSSDDSGDGEYGGGDKEDLVFVAKINEGAVGDYGIYDYEIKVPVELRNYDSTDSEIIYFYYDLV